MPEQKKKISPELLDWFRCAYGGEYDEDDATDRWLIEERQKEIAQRREKESADA